jgi:hypothetical protein
VLRHQLHVLQRQVTRPRLRPIDRLLLAGLSRWLPRAAWSSFFVSPATLLRWHRRLVARRWTYSRQSVGGPRTDRGICERVLRLVRENPIWAIAASTASWSASGSGRAKHDLGNLAPARDRAGAAAGGAELVGVPARTSIGDHRV